MVWIRGGDIVYGLDEEQKRRSDTEYSLGQELTESLSDK